MVFALQISLKGSVKENCTTWFEHVIPVAIVDKEQLIGFWQNNNLRDKLLVICKQIIASVNYHITTLDILFGNEKAAKLIDCVNSFLSVQTISDDMASDILKSILQLPNNPTYTTLPDVILRDTGLVEEYDDQDVQDDEDFYHILLEDSEVNDLEESEYEALVIAEKENESFS